MTKIGILGFGEKPQTEIVQKISKNYNQVPEYDLENVFNKIWLKINNSISMDLNLKGRNFMVVPVLKKHGFTKWDKIEKEIELIDSKKSNQSYAVRQAIVHIHALTFNEYMKIKYKK